MADTARHRHPRLIQRGGGLGNIFRSIVRRVRPLIQKLTAAGKAAINSPAGQETIRDVKKQATSSGMKLVSNLLAGKNPTKQLKRDARKMGSDLSKKVASMDPNPTREKPPRKKRAKKVPSPPPPIPIPPTKKGGRGKKRGSPETATAVQGQPAAGGEKKKKKAKRAPVRRKDAFDEDPAK